MLFTINFATPNRDDAHIRGLTDTCGMHYMQYLKYKYKVLRNVPMKEIHIDITCPSFMYSIYSIHVAEDIMDASKVLCDVFATRCAVNVCVPDGFLSRYYIEKVVRSTYYNKVPWYKIQKQPHAYTVKYRMDNHSLLMDWIESKCALRWGITDNDFIDKQHYLVQYMDGGIYETTGNNIADVLNTVHSRANRHTHKDTFVSLSDVLLHIKSIELVTTHEK